MPGKRGEQPTFKALKCAKKLEEAGIPREQAEAQVQIISEIFEMNLPTKQDMAMLRQDFLMSEQRLEQKIIQSEQRMTIKLGTIFSVAIGIAVALAKLLH